MRYFNFDTTFKTKKETYTVKDNELKPYSINAKNANALIKQLQQIIEKQITNANANKYDFDRLVEEIRYLEEGCSLINSIKAQNCSYHNKDREILESEVYMMKVNFLNSINWNNFSYAQQLVVQSITSYISNPVQHWDMQKWYNPVTNDSSKLDTFYKEVMSFNYQKYKVNKQITEGIESKYFSVKGVIAKFQTILSQAGNDIVNWSQHKVTRRLTSGSYYEISGYIKTYSDYLTTKGIKPEVKAKTSKDKLIQKVQTGEPTQEDYWKYYKQASKGDASTVLDKMELEYLYKIIDSNLKCVKDKIIGNGGYYNRSARPTIIKLLCEKSKTKEDYKKIIAWATPNEVTLDFMIKHKDHATKTNIKDFCSRVGLSSSEKVDENFYKTCLKDIPKTEKFQLNQGLTYQYMVRMSNTEKVEILKRIANTKVKVHYGTLNDLYKAVDYSLIRETILKNKKLLESLVVRLIEEKDNDALIKCAIHCGISLQTIEKEEMFKLFTYAKKKYVILEDCKTNSSNFTKAIESLSDDQCVDLLESLLKEKKADSYISKIFKHLAINKRITALAKANILVSNMDDIEKLPLKLEIISALTIDTKVTLLERGIDLNDSYDYGSYYFSSNGKMSMSNGLGKIFFQDFKRKDIDRTDRNLNSFRKFIAHTMTKEELENYTMAEISNWNENTGNRTLQDSFFRYNIELFSYSFLKQFKEKKSFKKVVGDRRNTSNRIFGTKLLKKLNVSQSIDFMFS